MVYSAKRIYGVCKPPKNSSGKKHCAVFANEHLYSPNQAMRQTENRLTKKSKKMSNVKPYISDAFSLLYILLPVRRTSHGVSFITLGLLMLPCSQWYEQINSALYFCIDLRTNSPCTIMCPLFAHLVVWPVATGTSFDLDGWDNKNTLMYSFA